MRANDRKCKIKNDNIIHYLHRLISSVMPDPVLQTSVYTSNIRGKLGCCCCFQ